ncbi:MAG: hypothetical protein IKX16_05770 [Clostridia bacterium]|nr:hypothetical protein [Clostridia bacterium]
MLSKEAPFTIVDRKEPKLIKKDELIAFLKGKGIAPVDKTPHGGAFWYINAVNFAQ